VHIEAFHRQNSLQQQTRVVVIFDNQNGLARQRHDDLRVMLWAVNLTAGQGQVCERRSGTRWRYYAPRGDISTPKLVELEAGAFPVFAAAVKCRRYGCAARKLDQSAAR
jgi:hypothetical protein